MIEMDDSLTREEAVKALNEIIDAVEFWNKLVRCKDCQFFDPTDAPSTAFPNVRRCAWLKIVMAEDGYCSYGRRKELKDDPSHPFSNDVMMEN